jgi:flagellar hook-associated protein 1 FlgK
MQMTGTPRAGDQFLIGFNEAGVSDNRNALALARLQTDRVLGGGNTSFFDAYAQLVESVGSRTSEARIQQEAAQGLLAQSVGLREAVSGVNLDEEAGNLIKFEQAYNASARVISVARDIFNVLFQMVA